MNSRKLLLIIGYITLIALFIGLPLMTISTIIGIIPASVIMAILIAIITPKVITMKRTLQRLKGTNRY